MCIHDGPKKLDKYVSLFMFKMKEPIYMISGAIQDGGCSKHVC